MASDILLNYESEASFVLSLAPGGVGLVDGGARQCTLLSNSGNFPAALVGFKIKSGGTAPNDGYAYLVYLIRDIGSIADDDAGASDAAIVIENAPLIGTIVVTDDTAKNFFGIFDTAPLGPLGPTWGVAIKNASGQSVDTTEGNHLKKYVYYNPQVQ